MDILDEKYREKDEEKRNYDYEYNLMQLIFLQKSIGMSLKNIIEKIQKGDKEYIFDFIKHPTIVDLTKGIYGLYKFNRDEVTDIIIFAITEFFYENKIDLDTFDEELFLLNLRKNIRTTVQKHIRQGYSGKEYPSSGWSVYENLIANVFDENQVIKKIELENAINNLPPRDKEVLDLYYNKKYTQQEIGEKMNLSQVQISNILRCIKHNLNNISR